MTEKREAVIAKLKCYLTVKLKGIKLNWVEKDRGLWLKVKRVNRKRIAGVWESKYVELNVCEFRSRDWGFGWTLSNGLAWRFSYSDRVVSSIEENVEFQEGMELWVMGRVKLGREEN